MQLKYLIPLPFVALIIFSCQRDAPLDRITDNTSDSIYLKQYTELDTTLPTGSDTLLKSILSYDAQKRVIMVSEYNFTFDELTVSSYFYSGSDTLPYKSVVNYDEFINDYRDTSFFTYTNGIVSKDSTISYDITNNSFFGIDVKVFTPSGTNTFIQGRGYYSLSPTTPDYQWSGSMLQTRVNGNLTIQDDTSTFNLKYSIRDHHEAVYDNKINPFYKVPIHYPINDFEKQENNLIEERAWDLPRIHERGLQYSYIYRSDGYPLSVTITGLVNSPDKRKGIFSYTD